MALHYLLLLCSIDISTFHWWVYCIRQRHAVSWWWNGLVGSETYAHALWKKYSNSDNTQTIYIISICWGWYKMYEDLFTSITRNTHLPLSVIRLMSDQVLSSILTIGSTFTDCGRVAISKIPRYHRSNPDCHVIQYNNNSLQRLLATIS